MKVGAAAKAGTARGRAVLLIAFIAAALVAAGCSGAPVTNEGSAPGAAAMSDAASGAAPVAAASPGEPVESVVGQPSRMVVPSIDLDEPLIGLGLTDAGEMEVPTDYGDVGWFTGGGRPGGIGPTVLAGHVDSTTGPAVFDRLTELGPGDTVTVWDESGVAADYRVDRVEDFAKDRFPTAEIFGATPDDVIRLITCAGDFDSAVGSYERNFVVFAVRV